MNAEAPALRDRLRRQRRSLKAAERGRAERAVARHLLELPELHGHGRAATYLAADGELDPNRAVGELRGRGWIVHLPVVGADRSMAFAEWHGGEELVPNRYGIGEPAPCPDHPPRSASALDVVLVPCVAVDEAGNRVGMGAGFYDRALAGVRDGTGVTLLVGIVHDHAVLEALTPEPWDVPLDLVVTERRVLRPRQRTA